MKYLIALLLALLFTDTSLAQTPEYGICVETVVPVRKTTQDNAEQITQVLFGDAFKILETAADKQWIRIENSFDKYEGWIRAIQSRSITAKYFEAYQQSNHPVALDTETEITLDNLKVKVPRGATLPFYENGKFKIGKKKYTFTGKVKAVDVKVSPAEVIDIAKLYTGCVYLWGGRQPYGVDCSGLMQMSFKIGGYRLPRDSYQQAEVGTKIAFKDAKAGDLAFFQKQQEGDGKVMHVGIYLGDGKILHASDVVRINTLDATGIWREERSAYSHYLKFLRRME